MKSRVLFPALSASVLSKTRFWIFCAGMLALLSLCSAETFAQSAKAFYKQGQAAETREDYDAAFQNFQKAYTMSPKDEVYRTAYYRVRFTDAAMHVTKGRNLAASGDDQGALVELLRAAEIDPSNEAAQQEIAKIRSRHADQPQPQTPQRSAITAITQAEMEGIGSPPQLKPTTDDHFVLRVAEDSKTVYQAIGKEAGINVLFDPDYISKRIQVDLNNVSLMDALRIVGTLSGTFWRPITQNTIFVAANTRSKRAELDEQAVQTFYLANAWQQNDLNDVQTALRNVLPNAKVYGVASQNAIVMRATPDELLLAQKLVTDLDKARPEVVVDIAVLEVSKNWERNLGIQWPGSASVQMQSPTTSTTTCPTGSTDCTPSTTNNNLTLYNLAHLTSNDFAVTVGQATANALLTDNNTHILQNPRIRAADQQKATLKIGSQIPIATGSYQTGAATALVSSLVNTQFQYQDVGVNIEVTPTVHYDRDITLKIKIEVKAQSGSVTISGVTEPIISQRVAEQTIRLREGEANILGGINEQQIQDNWSGIPGLSQIPILRYLFGSHDKIRQDDEIVFLVVPHVVRSQDLSPLNLRSIDTGSGLNVELRHTSTAAPPPPAMSPGPARPNVGSVPGSSAEGAANSALNQMKSSQDNALAPPAAGAAPDQSGQSSAPAGKVNLMLNLPSSVINGTTFQVPVVLTGGSDVTSVPLQIQYDPAKLSLVNVGDGDLLTRDGQVVQMAHRDDGPGDLTVNVSRPPGTPGVSGAGVVCVLTFQAKASGSTNLGITRGGATTSAGKSLQAQTSQSTLNVQ
jgi:general secretion pathway protein D